MASVNHLVDVVVSMAYSYLSFCETSGTAFDLPMSEKVRLLFFQYIIAGRQLFLASGKSTLRSVCCI